MRRSLGWLIVGVALIVLLLLGGGIYWLTRAVHPPEVAKQATYVVGQGRYAPGAEATLRVLVRNVASGAPIAAAKVVIGLRPASETIPLPLYEGETDELGVLAARFIIPDNADPKSVLVVQTLSPLGEDKIEQPVDVVRDFKVLVSTDKPIYQPTQTIHIRAVTFDAMTLAPAVMQPVEITISDAKGNKVLRRSLLTSAYGVVAVDFTLADEVNSGVYKITVTVGDTTSETSVTVEPYVLPKFHVVISTERPYYLPGETVRGTVQADYFFGKPVEGTLELIGYTFDVQLQEALHLVGQTNAQGTYAFEFELPPYFVSGNPEQQLATFLLEAQVKDGADHVERAHISIPVAQQPLVLEAVPESGTLVPGVENIVYVMAATPDGLPVTAELTLSAAGQTATLTTGAAGLAEWRFIPDRSNASLTISARDAQGRTATRTLTLEAAEQALLLRPERAVYTVGETLKAEIFAPWSTGTVYLDVVRAGQTLSTRALELKDRRALAVIDLDSTHYGTLELHAYALTADGMIYRDTRLVVVEQARDLDVTITPGQDTYAPGDTAHLSLTVSGAEGGTPAVLGLVAVDEAVYALQEQDPGFLKLYFLLEKDLLQPRYDLHGWTLPSLLETERSAAQDEAAQAALAPYGGTGALLRDTRAAAQAAVSTELRRAQERAAQSAMPYLYPLVFGLPLMVAGLAVGDLARQRRLLAGLLSGLAGLALFVLLGVALVRGLALWDWFMEMIWRYGLGLLFGMVALSLGAWIVQLVRSLQQRDLLRGLSLGFVLVYMGALVILGYVTILSGVTLPERVAIFILVGLGLVPLIYLVWSGRDVAERAWWSVAANVILALGLLVLPFVALSPMLRFSSPSKVVNDIEMLAGLGGTPVPGLPPMPETQATGEKTPSGPASTGQAPRLRQNFGETLLWMPEVLTDEQGRADLEVPLFDNITTWRITALAHTQDGRIGSATAPLRVFQDFFVDFDVPYALTQNDEVSLPVAVYNYLDEEQSLDVVLEQQDWFKPLDGLERTLTVGANDVTVVRFRIRVTAAQGRYRPVVWAYGERLSDATTSTHDVLIQPNGKRFDETWTINLSASTAFTQELSIPELAIPGTARLDIKVYPGVFSQLVEGMDAIFQMPYGCFEQTSSTTYPNVLALDYLHTTGQETPEIRLKAEQYINLGYQRLTTFEVEGGGFSLFGEAPADRMLTAYGLMEFSDMARVYPVDPAFVARAAEWLLKQQAADGSWENDRGLVHESSWQNLGNDRVPVTAYISWALIQAGYGDRPEVQAALSYLRAHHGEVDDAYALALVANALVAADAQDATTAQVLERLLALAQEEGDAIYWRSSIATMTGARETSASLETTALAAQALLKAGTSPMMSSRALTYLVRHKDPNGTWGTTQATILALKALLLGMDNSARPEMTVRAVWNGLESGVLDITPEAYDVVQGLSLTTVGNGLGTLVLRAEGSGEVLVQVTASYYLPWDVVPPSTPEEQPLELVVSYDRTALQVEDTVQVQVSVRLKEGLVNAALLDLGLPPGFSLVAEDLQQRIADDAALPAGATRITRYELTGRQVLVYVQDLQAGETLRFSYRLRARFPLRATIPASRAYDYYNPNSGVEQPPAEIEVTP